MKIFDQAQPEGPKVFLSYARDDEAHADAVLCLANFLVTRGIVVDVDDWHSGCRRDRYAWVLREIQAADFVIVVASPGYRAVGDGSSPHDLHRGVQAEAAVLRDLLYGDRGTWLGRVLPVVLPGQSLDDLPAFTQPYSASHFVIDDITDGGVEALLRVLTKQPRHVRPSIGRIPELGTTPDVAPQVDVEAESPPATEVEGVRRRPLGARAWKIAVLAMMPLLAGGPVAAPSGWSPVFVDAASNSAGATGNTHGPGPTTTGVAAPTGPGAASASGGIQGEGKKPTSGRELSEAEFRRAEMSQGPKSPGQTPTGSTPSQRGSLEILAVGHSFLSGTDRITINVRNTHSEPVLVKEIDIYMSDWGSGRGWSDGEWHFTTSGEMYAANPSYDGTIRTHGWIKLAGSEFSEPLVGQGYVDDEKGSWRRLLTFSPQKSLDGAGTVSIVIDLPTTHLLQSTSPDQPAGPVVQRTFDPEKGSLFTRVDLHTPEDSTFACDYLRREPDKPVCDSVDTLASVALPQ